MAGAERKARIGFIGAGWWATANHMPALAARDDVELAAVCRLGADELQQVRQQFGFEYATEDYRELLDNVELDGVVVASPHTLHYEHALAALERGLHVMCEKPLTTSGAHARRLVEVAAERGVEIVIPYGWHYKPYVQEARNRLNAGAVGTIEFVMCHMASPVRGLLEGGLFDASAGGTMDLLFEPASDTWADPERAGGGYALAQMSHSAGMAFWLTGLRAETVTAMTSGPTSKVELYDAFAVRFEGGAIGTFSGAGAVPDDKGFQLDVRVYGSEGLLILDIDRARLEVQRYDGNHFAMDLPGDAGAYECSGPPNNFADIVLGKTTVNHAPGVAGMRATEMIDAAYRSAASGRPESV